MVKLVFMVYRRPDLTAEQFRDHWLGEHAKLVRSMQETIRIRRYVQSHLLPPEVNSEYVAARGMTLEDMPDGVAEAWWDSWEDMNAGFQGEEGERLGELMREDEARFVDYQRSRAFLTEEKTIIAGEVPDNVI